MTSHGYRNAVRQRYADIQERISAACRRSGRDESAVKIVAVTKYLDVEQLGDVLEAGIVHIGENRVQDAQPKLDRFGHLGTWHFIGHLQTNKVKDVISRFHFIHSLDRLSLAREVEKRASALGIVVPCFMQVNISGEETKFGVNPSDVLAFAEEISNMKHIKVIGLMTMAPHVENPEETRPVFRGLREWRDRLQSLRIPNLPCTELSMGMSNDFEVAVEEGATFVRIGSVLVKPDEHHLT
jgi:pyridoxal phosphate enzyme (YggS family)